MASAKVPDLISGFSISKVLRYAYPGFLLAALLAGFEAPIVSRLVDSAGPALSILILFFLGAALYVIYRYVLGELVLYNLHHFIHYMLDRTISKRPTSPTGYLGSLGVRIGQRRAAYTALRREFLPAIQRDRFDEAHSEIHLLWMTFLAAGGVTIYASINRAATNPPTVLRVAVFLCALLLIAAIITDTMQAKVEYRTISSGGDRRRVTEFLERLGFIAPAREALIIHRVPNTGDERGRSYYWPEDAVEYMTSLGEVHVCTINPGEVRGNHAHEGRRELIFVAADSDWRLKWCSPESDTETKEAQYCGEAAVLQVAPGTPHAIRNEGHHDLTVISLSNGRYDPRDSDTRVVRLLQRQDPADAGSRTGADGSLDVTPS